MTAQRRAISGAPRLQIMRSRDWARPVPPAHREVISDLPARDEGRPPLLFVPGLGHAAWAFAEHWLEHAAGRGFPAYAMSLRGQAGSGPAPDATLRAYTHDVVQVAASLPRQAVLVGHGAGARVVEHALARYPARAGVLVSPVLGGWGTLGLALRRNPLGTLPALFGARLRLSRRQLFSRDLPDDTARVYQDRLGRIAPRVQRQLLGSPTDEPPVGDPPVLVLGSPDDRVVPAPALAAAAHRHNTAPLLFPGMGHDLMLDVGWVEPIDAILDWLDKNSPTTDLSRR